MSVRHVQSGQRVSNILSKLHLSSRTQATLFALREGLTSLDDASFPLNAGQQGA